MAKNNSKQPIVIAHRGASGYLPEHTLAAKALAHGMGADFLEQDVVLTSDAVPIILHDIHLHTTTDVRSKFPNKVREDGSYYAADFSLAEIKQLSVHERSSIGPGGIESAVYPNRYPLADSAFQVPTLSEEIELILGLNNSREHQAGLYLEFKAPQWHLKQGLDLVAAVMAVLKDKALDDKPELVYLQCFDDLSLKKLQREYQTTLPLIQLIADNSWGEDGDVDYEYLQTPEGLIDIASYAQGIGPWVEQIYLGRDDQGHALTNSLVSEAQALGLQVHPYTFRRDDLPAGMDTMAQLLALFIDQLGVDGLFTDFPDLAVKYVEGKTIGV